MTADDAPLALEVEVHSDYENNTSLGHNLSGININQDVKAKQPVRVKHRKRRSRQPKGDKLPKVEFHRGTPNDFILGVDYPMSNNNHNKRNS